MAKRRPSDINLLIGIDKPTGCTSHDIVARVRRAVGERRVGHAGTLDPLASGVMVVGIGQATRLLGMATLDAKSYLAQIDFGYETTTDDAEGERTRTARVPAALRDETYARTVLSAMVGEHDQVPPAYSAISVDGVRSYARARRGEAVELEARRITVRSAYLISITADDDSVSWTVSCTVSKGTYIRALARDLGRAVESAAHLGALRRTSSGAVGIGSCIDIEELDCDAARAHALDPVALLGLCPVVFDAASLPDVLCGKRLSLSSSLTACEVSAGARIGVIISGELRAIGVLRDGRIAPSDVFPQGIEGVRL